MKDKAFIYYGSPCTACLADPQLQSFQDAQRRGPKPCPLLVEREKCSPPRFGCIAEAGARMARCVLRFYTEASEETLALDRDFFRRRGPLPPEDVEAYIDTAEYGHRRITDPKVVVQRVWEFARAVLDLKEGERVLRAPGRFVPPGENVPIALQRAMGDEARKAKIGSKKVQKIAGNGYSADGYEFVQEIATEPGGEYILWCAQCGTCSGSCPNVQWMDHSPRKVIALVRAGKRKEVLSSNSMWCCASCHLCTVRCPKGVEMPELMHVLECIATREGITKGGVSAPTVYRTLADVVNRQGRVHELGLMGRFFLRTNPLAALRMMPVGLKLLRHGRLPLRGEKIEGTEQIKAMLKEVQTIGGGK